MRPHPRSTAAGVAALAWVACLITMVSWSALVRGQVVGRRDGVINNAAPAAASPVAQAPAPASTQPAGPALTLTNGGFTGGELLDSAQAGAIRWKSPAFVDPVEFRADALASIRWPNPPGRVEPAGDFRFELAGGDVAFGQLVALDDASAELDLPGLGRFRLDRKAVQRIQPRRRGAEILYSGPNGLAEWQETKGKGTWREESGQPITDQPGAGLQGEFPLPDRAVIEFEVSWKGAADFVLALGTSGDAESLRQAFRFEVWGGTLVVNRESGDKADLAAIGQVADLKNRVQLIAYLDQAAGRLLVVGPNGKPIADLTVPSAREPLKVVGNPPGNDKVAPASKSGIALINIKGDVRLDRLRVGRWDGVSPRSFDGDRSRIHLADGTVSYGQVLGYDGEARTFLVKDEAGESRVGLDRIADVFLSRPDDAPARAVRASLGDGTRLSGDLIRVEGGRAELAVPGFRDPVPLPVAALRMLAWLRAEAATNETPNGRLGTLEAEGIRLPGALGEGRVAGNSGLAWKPIGGSAGALRPDFSGQITYVEPKSPGSPAAAQPLPPPQRPNAALALNNMVGQLTNTAARRKIEARQALHLRTGDVIPGEITSIDEEGVRFKSPLAPGTFVPHAKVKAVELVALDDGGIKVGKAKRERLLTLPRMQKGSPPTQLIRSVNGDYLRGRILSMDQKKLEVEIHLDPKPIPRERISRIIWFHADELDPTKAPTPTPEEKSQARIQAIRSDGVRITFRPEGFVDGAVAGSSDVLGAVTVKPDDIDQILLGSKIEQTAAQVAYGKWILHNAEEPKFVKGTDGGETPSGTDSPMVGKLAPDFTLDLLDGQKFHLADNKGQVVILDFWATWCGPCLQAMPQVERAAKEFKDKGVKLIAVNLQEAPRDIKAMLERQKFDVTVALDRDGVVAEKYAATAIPQTVVIDRQGNVARLYVGSSPDLEERLKEVLTAIDKPAPAPAPK